MQTTVTETPYGSIRGAVHENIIHYGGVPYAKPPIGALRFRPPEQIAPWSDILDATTPGPVAPQLPSRLDDVMGRYPVRQDEDCLRLEIWAPKDADELLDVVVFLHGGAFMTGGGALPCYSGELLAGDSNVIVVNVTYRLGVLGFLSIDQLAPGNLGLRDQILALRWIRQCIGSFGGNPRSITVVGQSAGATSAAALMADAEGPELFDRAVLMSTPLGAECLSQEVASEIGETFLRLLSMEEHREAAHEVSVESLLEAQGKLLRHYAPEPGVIDPIFFPVVDHDVIKKDITASISDGATDWCDVVLGTTREELACFYFLDKSLPAVAGDQLQKECRRRWGDDWQLHHDRIRSGRAGGEVEFLADYHCERIFTAAIPVVGGRGDGNGPATYVYRFDWQAATQKLGACHCIDLPFLFGNFDRWSESPMVAGIPDDESSGLSRIFRKFIVSFAQTGNPNSSGLPVWPLYGDRRYEMHFDRYTEAVGRLLPEPGS